jgi:hypothetical protein
MLCNDVFFSPEGEDGGDKCCLIELPVSLDSFTGSFLGGGRFDPVLGDNQMNG